MTTHYIGCAYPSSAVAKSLGCAKVGTWYLKVGNTSKPFLTFEAATAATQGLSTKPDRWSHDHPDNAHFRDHP